MKRTFIKGRNGGLAVPPRVREMGNVMIVGRYGR